MSDDPDYSAKIPHATEVPRDTSRLYPDVYVNGPDDGIETLTIDPYKNRHWMRDDSEVWQAQLSEHRGALKNHASVMMVQHLIETDPLNHPNLLNFEPTTAQIDRQDKFSPKCVMNSTRGNPAARLYKNTRLRDNMEGDGVYNRGNQYGGPSGSARSENYGKLPVISKQIYNNTLGDKVDFAVEREMWFANTHGSRSRAFDCGEFSGLPCR